MVRKERVLQNMDSVLTKVSRLLEQINNNTMTRDLLIQEFNTVKNTVDITDDIMDNETNMRYIDRIKQLLSIAIRGTESISRAVKDGQDFEKDDMYRMISQIYKKFETSYELIELEEQDMPSLEGRILK